MSCEASKSQRGWIWQVNFLKMKEETMQKEDKSSCQEKDGNFQKQGKAKHTQKQESTEKVVRNKACNLQSRKVQFPNGMKETRMETSLRTQTC